MYRPFNQKWHAFIVQCTQNGFCQGHIPKVHSEPSQTSKMEILLKKHHLKCLTAFRIQPYFLNFKKALLIFRKAFLR